MFGWLYRWLERQEAQRAKEQQQLFDVRPDGTWPSPVGILPGGSFHGLRGSYGDGAMNLPSGGPRVGSDGTIKFFDRDE